VSNVVLTPAERALLEALNALGIRYLIVGMERRSWKVRL